MQILDEGLMSVKKIGVIVGREWSFPPAFIEEVNSRNAGVIAEYVKLGGTPMNEPCEYAVLIDRISHEIPYYRTYLKNAMLQGAYCINNPFWWSADDKFFGASLITKLGIASPTHHGPAHEVLPGRGRQREPAQPDLPAGLGSPSSAMSGCRPFSRMPGAAAGRMSTRSTRSTS